MTKANETNGIDKSNLVKVNEDQFIEEFLPQIVCTNANCEVVARPIPDAPADIMTFLFFNDWLTINYDFVNEDCNSLLVI